MYEYVQRSIWSRVVWLLTHHGNRLLSSRFYLLLNSSEGHLVGIRPDGDMESQSPLRRIMHEAEEDTRLLSI